jgi:choline dehydrogenase
MIEQATQDLLATPEDTPLPNDPSDWRAVSERRENMSFIPVAVG